MTVVDIGVRELQRETSRVIQDVENNGTTFRVKVQGRPTPVVVRREPRRSHGVSLEELLHSPLYRGKTAELVSAQLEEIEAGRDAFGRVGQPQ